MITLTICNHKGGTGKTTTSINLSAALALSGSKVLVVDLDPQGFLTRMMGQAEPEVSASSLMLFESEISAAPPILKLPTFDLIPSSPALSTALRKLTKPTDVLWAKEYIQTQIHGYDMVILDTAAAVTVYSLNALVASDLVIIPVLPEYQPVIGAEQTYQTVKMVRKSLNPGLGASKFLFTMVDGRKRNHHAYRHYMREKYQDDVMTGIVRTCTTLSVSSRDGRTVYDSNPHARGAIDYANVADEISTLIQQKDEATAREMDPERERSSTAQIGQKTT
jgi:chromosome partitioning protein